MLKNRGGCGRKSVPTEGLKSSGSRSLWHSGRSGSVPRRNRSNKTNRKRRVRKRKPVRKSPKRLARAKGACERTREWTNTSEKKKSVFQPAPFRCKAESNSKRLSRKGTWKRACEHNHKQTKAQMTNSSVLTQDFPARLVKISGRTTKCDAAWHKSAAQTGWSWNCGCKNARNRSRSYIKTAGDSRQERRARDGQSARRRLGRSVG